MRIMTTNIWGDYFNNPVSLRLEDLLRVYEVYRPDVIGFQECTASWWESGLFSRLADDYQILGEGLFPDGNYVPLAVGKQYEVVSFGGELYEETPDPSKGFTWAVLRGPEEKVFGVCNTHFWWKGGEEHDRIRGCNARQLSYRMKVIQKEYSCPVFAFGDLNCWPDNLAFAAFKEQGVKELFHLAEVRDDRCTLHGNPVLDATGHFRGALREGDHKRAIDHILSLGEGFSVPALRVVEDSFALDATDHSPVYADIILQ